MHRLYVPLVLLAGCTELGIIETADPPAPPPPPPVPLTVGLIDSPHHGQLGVPQDLVVRGETDQPGRGLVVQLRGEGDWQTVVTMHSEPVAVADGGYPFTAVVPQAAQLAVWPSGGLLRLRVMTDEAGGGRPLAVLADDSEAQGCLAQYGSGTLKERITRCAYPVHDGLIMVDTRVSPVDTGDHPLFLDRKGQGDDAETQAYYTARDMPLTLTDFITRYGLGSPAEISAAYYNSGDLAVGRDMHCAQFDTANGPGLACASSNFGAFSGNQTTDTAAAIAGHESGLGAFATVCMVYTPPITAPDSVAFVVYGGNGQQVTSAQLDRFGNNTAVPQNCLNCHGSGAKYDATTHSVSGARFLPFDPQALSFSGQAGFSFGEQAEAFRMLNAMIDGAGPAPGVQEVLINLYPSGVELANSAPQLDFVPEAWQASAPSRAVYRSAIAPFCRGCHQTHSTGTDLDALTFADADGFLLQHEAIGRELCGAGHGMPNAEVVARRFWASPARAYLADFLELDACSPSVAQ